MEKIRKEKRNLDQRQRNLTMQATTTRKEKDEIERLTKEMAKMQADHNAEKSKTKMQMDRLKKQNEDLTKKNKDL